jgi:hypothetical protein
VENPLNTRGKNHGRPPVSKNFTIVGVRLQCRTTAYERMIELSSLPATCLPFPPSEFSPSLMQLPCYNPYSELHSVLSLPSVRLLRFRPIRVWQELQRISMHSRCCEFARDHLSFWVTVKEHQYCSRAAACVAVRCRRKNARHGEGPVQEFQKEECVMTASPTMQEEHEEGCDSL